MLNYEETLHERVRAANIPAMCFEHLLDAAQDLIAETGAAKASHIVDYAGYAPDLSYIALEWLCHTGRLVRVPQDSCADEDQIYTKVVYAKIIYTKVI